MTSHPLGVDSSEHDLIIGSSFNKSGNTAFHSLRFDFKPASVDKSQPCVLEVSDKNNVTVTVPHIEQGVNKSQTHTIYKGNKRPLQKDCVLIIDHETGDIRLEKLSYNIALKKTRQERNNPIPTTTQLPRLTTDIKKLKSKNKKTVKKDVKEKDGEKSMKLAQEGDGSPPVSTTSTPTPPSIPSPAPATSVPSFDFGSDSDSNSEPEPVKSTPVSKPSQSSSNHNQNYISTLSEDLLLSESGSDSD